VDTKFFLMDPNVNSEFAVALGDRLDATVQVGWNDFTRELGVRVSIEQLQRLSLETQAQSTALGFPLDATGASLIQALGSCDLFELGRVRAAWMLEDRPYSREPTGAALRALACLVAILSRLVDSMLAEADVQEGGVLALRSSTGAIVRLLPGHGMGGLTHASATERLEAHPQNRRPFEQPIGLLIGCLAGPIAPQLVRDASEDDLVRGPSLMRVITDDELSDLFGASPQEVWERLATPWS
jgi:hypothetical protein